MRNEDHSHKTRPSVETIHLLSALLSGPETKNSNIPSKKKLFKSKVSNGKQQVHQ